MTIIPMSTKRDMAGEADEVAQLCSDLLASLSRSDQRRRGVDYVRGLLVADGRKTIRNIAGYVGGHGAEQRLHHFVSGSTWDWRPVRRVLAAHLCATLAPSAWVLRPLTIPKSGRRSVGVRHGYHPALDQTRSAQTAVGLWAAARTGCAPANWRLQATEGRPAAPALRRREPEAAAETTQECAIRCFRELAPELRGRPVVLDMPVDEPAEAVAQLAGTGFPMLVRVAGDAALVSAGARPAGRGAAPRPARSLLREAGHRRAPVRCPDTGGWKIVATVPVLLPSPQGPSRLLLVGAGNAGSRWPSRLWLTNLASARPADLAELTTLPERVGHYAGAVAEHVGIADFTGRSFAGWHRHMTLASIAHAVQLGRRAGDRAGDRADDHGPLGLSGRQVGGDVA